MTTGKLIVVSAPSGAGKTTICHRLQQAFPDYQFSISATTRPRRPNEIDGRDYFFFSEQEFDRKVAQNEFVEWEYVHGFRYGTLLAGLQRALDKGHILLLDVDVKGGVSIKNRFPADTVAVFIDPPDLETLKRRLKGRGTDNEEAINKRLSRIPEEVSYKNNYDYVVVNDNLDKAVDEISRILKGA